MSKVWPRSSEVKVPQVEQEVVTGVGDPWAAPTMDTEDMEIAFKSTTGMVTYGPTKQSHGRTRIRRSKTPARIERKFCMMVGLPDAVTRAKLDGDRFGHFFVWWGRF